VKTLALATVALFVSAGVASAQLDGRWGLFTESCTAPDSTEIMRIDTAEGVVGFYESACDIAGLASIGEFGAWKATLTCSGEGETWTDNVVFGVFEPWDGSPERLARIDMNDGFTAIYFRCE